MGFFSFFYDLFEFGNSLEASFRQTRAPEEEEEEKRKDFFGMLSEFFWIISSFEKMSSIPYRDSRGIPGKFFFFFFRLIQLGIWECCRLFRDSSDSDS